MYVPPHFALTDPEALRRVMREHPLGVLVTHGPSGLDANHLPFELQPDEGPLGTLRAHVARANPVWREAAGGVPAMVVFRGVEGYVSPSWYPSKHETHRQVPTWNYEVVHAHGTLAVLDDERYVRGVVARLTRTHESTEPAPWRMGDAPPDYVEAMLQAIVGLSLRIERIEGKSKLSQNKDARDRRGAIGALEARGRGPLARAMRGAGGDA
jgi:transcriptional regulator